MTGIEISPAQARELTDRIKLGLDTMWEMIKQAWVAEAHTKLGYASWDEYCTREFGANRIRVPRAERQEIVASMRELKMSTRAIASATGVSRRTLIRDSQSGGDNVTTSEPATVTGTDGKTYTPKPRLAPVPDPTPEPVLSFDDEPEDDTPEWEEVAHIPPARLKDVAPRPTAVNIPQEDLDALNTAPGNPPSVSPAPKIHKPLDEGYRNPKEHLIDLMSHLKKASKAIEDAVFTARHIDSWNGGPISGDLRELLDQLDAALDGGSFDAELARLIEGEK